MTFDVRQGDCVELMAAMPGGVGGCEEQVMIEPTEEMVAAVRADRPATFTNDAMVLQVLRVAIAAAPPEWLLRAALDDEQLQTVEAALRFAAKAHALRAEGESVP